MTTARQRVSFRSRFPEIVTKLDAEVDDALLSGAKLIAMDAASRAPVDTGALRSSIEARAADNNQVEIMAAWYWFFGEFGTIRQPPHPFMVPAAERGRLAVESAVKTTLRNL